MQIESQRLTNLVNDLVDLSRLQARDAVEGRRASSRSTAWSSEAVDTTKLLGRAREIDVVVGRADRRRRCSATRPSS